MDKLQSEFEFDDAKDDANWTIVLHNGVDIQLLIGLERVIEFLQYLLLDDLEFN
jgi:hypothetical protein